MRCAEFEDDEETPRWAAAKSVGYCKTCCLSRLDEEFDETKSSANNNKNSGRIVKDFSDSLKR